MLSEENREKRVFLLWMTDYFRKQLERTLAVLGIDVRNTCDAPPRGLQ